MNRRWRHFADRLYLDTCTLADVLLEPRGTKPSGSKKVMAREREREIARTIFGRWPTTRLIVSPYVIGEFIQLGRRQFHKSLAEMRQIVSTRVLSNQSGEVRCKTVYAKFNSKVADIYDVLGYESDSLVSLEIEGEATDEIGRHLPGFRGWVRVLRSGERLRAVGGGIPFGSNTPDPETTTFAPDSKITVQAPAFELMLFDRAAQIVEQGGVTWKDAFHFLYATWENADAIVTTDSDLIKAGAKFGHTYPIVMKPSAVRGKAMRTPEFYKDMFSTS